MAYISENSDNLKYMLMATRTKSITNKPMAARVRSRKQVTLPGEIYDKFGLTEGAFLTFVETKGTVTVPPGTVILSPLSELAPRAWTDEEWRERNDEALADIKAGHVSKVFTDSKSLIAALRSGKLKKK
jgi:bifunctional DNA-binding transcriptional regulator/antitoxin component of YhaV-PrlF toxin-antitoxin module